MEVDPHPVLVLPLPEDLLRLLQGEAAHLAEGVHVLHVEVAAGVGGGDGGELDVEDVLGGLVGGQTSAKMDAGEIAGKKVKYSFKAVFALALSGVQPMQLLQIVVN